MSNDALNAFYDRKYAGAKPGGEILDIQSTGAPRDRMQAAVKFFPRLFKGGDVLELGCGDGEVAKALLKRHDSIRSYTLGDLSLPRVERVLANLADPRAETLLLNAEQVDESLHGRFDAVIMIALIEHLIDPLGAMRQIRKLLKPGGFVYVDTPNIAKYSRRLKLMAGYFPGTSALNEGLTTYYGKPADLYDEGHLHYFTYRSLSMMLTDFCGYASVDRLWYPIGRHPLGGPVHEALARAWPAMFSEVVLAARA